MTWDLTVDDGTEIHAKALRRRLGDAAPRYARARAELLASQGDSEGEKIWQRVATLAERFHPSELTLPKLGL